MLFRSNPPHILLQCVVSAVRPPPKDHQHVIVADDRLFYAVRSFLWSFKSEVPFDRCPQLREWLDAAGVNYLGKIEYDQLCVLLSEHGSTAFDDGPIRDRLTELLLAQFRFQERSRPWLALASNVLGYVGAALFFIPSLETFIRVLGLYATALVGR